MVDPRNIRRVHRSRRPWLWVLHWTISTLICYAVAAVLIAGYWLIFGGPFGI